MQKIHILPDDKLSRNDFISEVMEVYEHDTNAPDLYQIKSGAVHLLFIINGDLTTKLAYRVLYGMAKDAKRLTIEKHVYQTKN